MKSTRREFIASAGAAAASLSINVPCVQAASRRTQGHVVRVTAARMLDAKAEDVVPYVARKMLNRAVREYFGKSKPADAWARLFGEKDKVGIKINCLGRPKMSTHFEMVWAVIAGLRSAGVNAKHISVFDMFGAHMTQSRYTLGKHRSGVVFTDSKKAGYEENWRQQPWGKVKFTNALLAVDKVVNIPMIKDHALSGVTGALKNMAFGTIVNPRDYHGGNCNPGIANVYHLAPIKDKTVLTVCDGAFIQFDGGPQFTPAARRPFRSLFVTQDPVALDKLMWEFVDDFRKRNRKPPLDKTAAKPIHIATAAGIGLGTDDRNQIKLVTKKV